MPTNRMTLLSEPDQLRGALVPLRRRLLRRLRTPASAVQLARELDLSRQKVNYHLRKLTEAGLIELVEERQRRGCVERIMQARADAYLIDPELMSEPAPPAGAGARAPAVPADPAAKPDAPGGPAAEGRPAPDRGDLTRHADQFAADHLVSAAAGTVRDVARMRAAADQAGLRLLTFTLESRVRLAAPADLHRFTEALANALAGVVAEFDTPDGRAYRLLGTGYPVPAPEPAAKESRAS